MLLWFFRRDRRLAHGNDWRHGLVKLFSELNRCALTHKRQGMTGNSTPINKKFREIADDMAAGDKGDTCQQRGDGCGGEVRHTWCNAAKASQERGKN